MTTEYSNYRHPKHRKIANMLRKGATNNEVARKLGVNTRAVARVRTIIGLPPHSWATTREAKLDKFSVRFEDGHTGWTGRRLRSKTPSIRQNDVEVPASHVAFRRRTGRDPVGQVRPDCDFPHCLTPEHLMDDMDRVRVRLQLRAIYGMPKVWDTCPKGLHTWAEGGRVRANLSLYCKLCDTVRAGRTRHGRQEKTKEGTAVA